MQRSTKHRIAVFLALLVVATVVANRVAARAGHATLASLLIMWSPGLAALAASVLTRRPPGAIGWRP
jgi:hypothetical protein